MPSRGVFPQKAWRGKLLATIYGSAGIWAAATSTILVALLFAITTDDSLVLVLYDYPWGILCLLVAHPLVLALTMVFTAALGLLVSAVAYRTTPALLGAYISLVGLLLVHITVVGWSMTHLPVLAASLNPLEHLDRDAASCFLGLGLFAVIYGGGSYAIVRFTEWWLERFRARDR